MGWISGDAIPDRDALKGRPGTSREQRSAQAAILSDGQGKSET